MKNYIIPFNDWLTLSEEMQRLARPHAQGVLKVTLTRGVGGKGIQLRQAACRPLAFSASFHTRRIMRAGGRRALL
ncbi:aminodeoxychorismate lyase [Klebsiella pneumoniae]|uniref:Aminodeoxychorismate lyase n=1 Tax=Klebsiella pneumoniae TaxID=573 RepID=A0A447S5N3_KLEPN|nr:aminodeoxychorismate lyase [Klebsiella pneumoniae]